MAGLQASHRGGVGTANGSVRLGQDQGIGHRHQRRPRRHNSACDGLDAAAGRADRWSKASGRCHGR
jgi:hypothetical protein